MTQQVSKAVLELLLKAYNRPVKDFYYFPEVILVGSQRVDPEDFFEMITNGFLQQTHRDNFGRFYSLSDKAKELLHQSMQATRSKQRKKAPTPHTQGLLQFC